MKGLEIRETGRKSYNYADIENYVTYEILLDGCRVGTMDFSEFLTEEQVDMLDVPYHQRDQYLEWTHCESIMIDPAYRNRGIGTAALEEMTEKYGRYTITPNNDDARRLYERIGTDSLSWDDAYYTDQGYGVYEIY